MKHLILGTAGHVDHGKTALVKALTNIECDTHKEEKQRGMTINLGFAHLDLPSGDSLGIVDVPGHKDFVHTMVGGASGIDLVMLVIAADSGVMPQTREHLSIMKVLGVKHGLVALTKIDLVEDRDLLELIQEEIREFVGGTFLEASPIIGVSAKSNEGIEALKDAIASQISQIEERPSDGVFRLFVDRIFSVSGFGTVVTGSVMSGSLKTKDKAYLLPGGKGDLTVRRMERHGEEVQEVRAGDRASINLVGLDKSDFSRGSIISDRPLKSTAILDARLDLFERSVTMGIWSQVIFHMGTFESQAKVHLIDKDILNPNESGLVQIHLPEPCVFQHGDRFVIRNSSSDLTLGGGEVIDVAPLVHRRRRDKLIKKMSHIAKGKLSDLISAEIRKMNRGVFREQVAYQLNISPEDVRNTLKHNLPKDILRYENKDRPILIANDVLERFRFGMIKAIKRFREKNPLIKKGATLEEIRGQLKIKKGSASEEVLRQLLQYQVQKGKLKEIDKTWVTADDMVAVDNKTMEKHLNFFAGYLKRSQYKVPLMNQMVEEAQKRNLSEKELKQILYNLTIRGEAYRVKDDYLHASIVHEVRDKMIAVFGNQEEGFSIGEFRDKVGGNRKFSLAVTALFDAEMITKRVGDLRIILKDNK